MKWKKTLLMLALMLPATACAPIGPIDACAGWAKIDGTAGDADVISDRLALSIAAHQEQGRALGCWD